MQINEERIRQIITESHSQKELADALKLSPSMLNHIIKGRRRAGRKVLVALVNYGIPFEELMEEGK